VLAICYGLQILNVYRSGTLIQHISEFLPVGKKDLVNHEAGRKVEYAHQVAIHPKSKLAQIAGGTEIAANSSHHQSAGEVGNGLRVVARCKEDGIIEALEGTSSDHFVLAVQWHPERTTSDAPSRGIFSSLVKAARARQVQLQREYEQV
jgi:putative glutamine amidotransferase